jgi:3-oxoacyl-[acyl-carrier-protein] synthase II
VSGRRVVVTGIGVVSPLGSTVDAIWGAMVAGESGVTDDLRFDAEGLACSVAAHVRGFDPLDHADARVIRTSDPASVMLLAAAREALAMAGPGLPAPADETGVVAGVDVAAISLDRAAIALDRQGPLGVDAFAITQCLPNNASALVVRELGPRGAHMAVSAACASGAVAVHQAAILIRAGHLGAAIAGCASGIDRLVAASCSAARVLTRRTDPATASRPFDLDRDGFVLGEGAAALVLEDRDEALRRGAPILAEILGGHQTASSAGATVNPAEDCAATMRGALRNAGVAPDEVDMVGAHATGTRVGDVQEARAIHDVFGGRRVPAVAAKSVLGHCMSAAAGLELVAAVIAVREGVAPPTMNRDTPDPECDLDCVPGVARPMDLRVVLKDAFGFGGVNCCIVLVRPEDGR